jgi:flagellar biosynthesis protein FlhG
MPHPSQWPAKPAPIENTGARIYQFRRPVPVRKRSIAITSGKGGVGKTQIAANIAVCMAQMGRRVMLLDANLGLAGLDLALGLAPESDLRTVLEGSKRVEEIIQQGPCGVQLVPACFGGHDMADISAQERSRIISDIDRVAEGFDVLIIDTGPGIGSMPVNFACSADEVLLVLTPDPTALRNAYAMAKVLERRGGLDKLYLVSNQVDGDLGGSEIYQQLDTIVRQCLTIDLDYLGSVPDDNSVRKCAASGRPFVLERPRSLAARAVRGIAKRLASYHEKESQR